MKIRVFSIITALLAWGLTLCAAYVPAHACCKPPVDGKVSAAMPCCISQPAVAANVSAPPPETHDWTALPALINPPPIFESLLRPARQSMLALVYVPDQSGRYLELRVLLN